MSEQESERITRPDGPEILGQLWEYLKASRVLHERLEALRVELTTELEQRASMRAELAELRRRVTSIERSSSAPPELF